MRNGLIWIGVLVLGFGGIAGGEEEGWEGLLSLRWNLLTERNGVAPDYQDLRGGLRLTTPAVGRYGARLHLDARVKEGLEERFVGPDSPYEKRRQVSRAFVEVDKLLGGQLQVGRHLPELRGAGAWEVDGFSWRRRVAGWSAALTGGYQVPFWEVDAPFDRGAVQWGGEIYRHPAGGRWEAGAALLRDEGVDGEGRWRFGLGGDWRMGRRLTWTGRSEADPVDGRWLSGRLSSRWVAGRRWSAGLSYGLRRTASFPVAAAEILYGGRVHDLGGWARWRWGGSLSGNLQIRSTYGAREFRSEQVQLSWADFPLDSWRLSLRLGDSWSSWRQVEQAGVQVQGRWGRRWSLASGVSALLFRWETARAPAWEMRFRPQLRLHFAPCRPLAWELVVEEQVDEFLHLRTQAMLGLSYQL